MRTIAQPTVSVNTPALALQLANASLFALRAGRRGQTAPTSTALHNAVRQEKIDAGYVCDGSERVENSSTSGTVGWLSALCEGVRQPICVDVVSADLPANPAPPTHITTFGTICTAILKQDGGTVGRVWLVLRAHFAGERQSGGVSAEALWQCLTATFPQYSRRHLRDLLQRGEGIYWQRDNQDRLWLTGITKVATHLGVTRLQGVRVVVPLADLTGKLTRMRVALQAAFHASRNSDSPISRATLRGLTGLSERSQRDQARAHGALISTKSNYCLDETVNAELTKKHAFEHQHNSFPFTDSKGKQGAQGVIYLAHQLPNSYTARYKTASRGRKRKINRQLNRVTQGARGTGWQQIEKVFYHDGAQAVNAINRGATSDKRTTVNRFTPLAYRVSLTCYADGVWRHFN